MNNEYNKALRIAITVYENTVKNCIAYKNFLISKKWKKDLQIYPKSFVQIPISDKYNYYQKYSLLEKLNKFKKPSDYYMITASTGSTGESTLWLRDLSVDNSLEKLHTDFIDAHFGIKSKKTLIVISFGLGSNTSGMLHARLSWEGSLNRHMSVITPGIDTEKTVYLIQQLYGYYDQVVCIGYPPFISEFIDLAIEKKINVKKWNLKIIFTSESVSSIWRKVTAQKISQKGEASNIVAFYACTEAGIIGIETPVTNTIINYCLINEKLNQDLFSSSNLPTLVEVNFHKKFIEVVDDEIIITTDQSIPLIRYNLHDRGKLLTAKSINNLLEKYKIEYRLKNDTKIYLCVFGKNEKGYVGSIYFEDIRKVIEQSKISSFVQNEFQFSEKENAGNINLSLHLYLKKQMDIPNQLLTELNIQLKALYKRHRNTEKGKNLKIITVKTTVKPSTARIGYKSGKLRYIN